MPPDAPLEISAAAPAAAPVAAPVVAAPPAPAVAATPAADVPAVVVVSEPAAAVAEAPAPVVEPAKIEGEAPKIDAAPAVVDPNAPKADAEAAPAVVEAPKYEFKMPEAIKMDAVQLGAYTGILAKHGIPQEAGQELMDLGATLIKSQLDAAVQGQHDAFEVTRSGWRAEVDKFGNQRDTIINDAKFAIVDSIKDAKERQAVWDVLGMTGAGDNPQFIKAMAKIGKRLRERSAPPADLPNNQQRNGSPADRRYGPKT